MDELYAFLFAGLMIIFLLFAFFGGPQVKLNYGSNSGDDKDFTANNITWKEIALGDIISKERTVQATELIEDNLSVHSGFFFGSNEYSRKVEIDPYIASNLNYATLNFKVENTNNYGLINVSVDNRTVFFENPLRGAYSVNMSKVNKTSIIYIKTESSGWRVWAPSMYEISNMSLDTSYTTKETPQYEFDVPHYVYGTFYKGEIKFDSIYPIDLKVFINGDPIFSKANSFGKTTIALTRKDIVPEANTIEFESVKDFRLENAKIYLYYKD